MPYNFIKPLIVLSLLTFIVSCDRPECNNTNPVFDNYAPEAKEYKKELAKQLKSIDQSKLSYWFDKYAEEGNTQFLYVDIHGDNLCATGILTVKNVQNKIDGIIKKKGLGYSGAQLKDVRFEIIQDSIKSELVFLDLGAVVD